MPIPKYFPRGFFLHRMGLKMEPQRSHMNQKGLKMDSMCSNFCFRLLLKNLFSKSRLRIWRVPPYPFAEKICKLVFVGRGIFERSAELHRNTLDMIKAICREILVTKSRAHFPSAGGIFERPVKIARDNTPRH